LLFQNIGDFLSENQYPWYPASSTTREWKRATAMQLENFRLADRAESESNRCRAFAPLRSLEPIASYAGAGRRVDGEGEGEIFRPATH
jgi:hypothetical protein